MPIDRARLEERLAAEEKRFVEAHLTYDDVKTVVRISSTWGAKISGEKLRERASSAVGGK